MPTNETLYREKLAQAKQVARANLLSRNWTKGQAMKYIKDTIAILQQETEMATIR